MPARNLYLTPGAEDALGARATGERDRSAVASRMMERYAEVCRRALPELSDAEWDLLRDSLNGGCPSRSRPGLVGRGSGTASRWTGSRMRGKDGPALLTVGALDCRMPGRA